MTRHELNKADRWFSQELSLTHAMVSPEPAHDLQTAVTSNPHDSISAHSINSCRAVCSVRDVLIATADRVHTQHTMPLLSTPAMRLYRWSTVTQCEALSGHLTDINKFYKHGSVHRESNLITVQQDATYSVYYISVGSSTCFGCWHPSSGARTTLITASGID